jgi:hypothetical protein
VPLKYSDLKAGDVLLKHSAGSNTNVVIKTHRIFHPKIVSIDADYRYISPKEMQVKLNQSADRSHPGRIVG